MICFDTTPLIWGMQDTDPDPAMQMNIERTKAYLAFLAEQKEQIIIPTPVLAEYLVKIPAEDHVNHITQLRDLFLVYPFDERAASLAALLRTQTTFRSVVDQISINHNMSFESARQIVKVDAMIVAIAVTRGASKLITDDKGMRALACDLIEAIPVPHIDRQLKLPDQLIPPTN